MVKQSYGQWPGACWTSGVLDWTGAQKLTAGVDIGTTSAQAAILCDGRLFGYVNARLGSSFAGIADELLCRAMGDSGMRVKDLHAIAATGFAARNVSCAGKTVDEIHCHAMGARFMFGPQVHTVVDLGAQSVKAIRLYDWDRVWDFMMNDKCATGLGRGLERVCELLQVPVTEIGALSLEVEADPEPVSTTCHAFACTETMGLFRPDFREQPLTNNEVYASYLFAIAWRILGVMGKLSPLDVGDIKVYEKLAFTGGLAKNPGITKRLERELKTQAAVSDIDPMLAGAIGAALLA